MSFRSLAEALLSGKPYFGTAFRAMQGVPERHQYFLPVVTEVARCRGGGSLDILEIGSWAGASTVSWALALRETGLAGALTCLDPWLPYFDSEEESVQHYRDMNAAARSGLIAKLFEHNIRTAGVAQSVRQHRDYSKNVLPGLPSGQFDIVYIDGSHRFEDVCFDIREAKRLLRDDGIICGDDLEIQAANLPEDELRRAIASRRDYVRSETGSCHYHPGVTGAVAHEFESVAAWAGFWAVQRSTSGWMAPNLDLGALRIPDHILQRHGQVRLVDSTETHNFVEADGSYFALHKCLGPVELFCEQLGDRELPPLIWIGASLEETRRKAAPEPAVTVPEPKATGPALTGRYKEFNLVTHEDRTVALRISLGPVDVAEGEDTLRERFGPEDFTVAADAATARSAIDQIELIRSRAALAAELACKVADLEVRVESLRATAVAERQSLVPEISMCHAAISALETQVGALQVGALQVGALETQVGALETQVSALETQVSAILERSASEAAAAEKLRIELSAALQIQGQEIAGWNAANQLDRDMQMRLQMATDEVSRKQNLLAHQFALKQYGPGDPETPCLAGEHFGFQLAHYQGQVYALRNPIALAELKLGDQALLAAHGPDNVIVGGTLDGVRARVEINHGLHELRAELAEMDRQSLRTRSETVERLEQLDTIVRTNGSNFEKLAQRWPNRLFNR